MPLWFGKSGLVGSDKLEDCMENLYSRGTLEQRFRALD